MRSGTFFRYILSGVIAGSIFVFFFLLLGFGVFLALVVGIAGYIATLLVFRGERRFEVGISGTRVSGEDMQKTLRYGEESVLEIRTLAGQIDDPAVKEKVEKIAVAVEKIFDNFKQDPGDIRRAREFLNYYLDATIKVIRRYAEISRHGIGSGNVKGSLDRAEDLMDSLLKAYEVQLARLLSNDVMDLDTEIEVLKKTMRYSGLEDLE